MPIVDEWHTPEQRTASKKLDEPFKNIHFVYCSLLYNPFRRFEPCLVAGYSVAERSIAVGIFKAWRRCIGAGSYLEEPA